MGRQVSESQNVYEPWTDGEERRIYIIIYTYLPIERASVPCKQPSTQGRPIEQATAANAGVVTVQSQTSRRGASRPKRPHGRQATQPQLAGFSKGCDMTS